MMTIVREFLWARRKLHLLQFKPGWPLILFLGMIALRATRMLWMCSLEHDQHLSDVFMTTMDTVVHALPENGSPLFFVWSFLKLIKTFAIDPLLWNRIVVPLYGFELIQSITFCYVFIRPTIAPVDQQRWKWYALAALLIIADNIIFYLLALTGYHGMNTIALGWYISVVTQFCAPAGLILIIMQLNRERLKRMNGWELVKQVGFAAVTVLILAAYYALPYGLWMYFATTTLPMFERFFHIGAIPGFIFIVRNLEVVFISYFAFKTLAGSGLILRHCLLPDDATNNV